MGCNRNNNDVSNVFFPNRDRDRNQVKATIDFDDLCRAVRRCIIEDLEGIQDDRDRDDRDDRDHRRHRRCGCLF
ncbi:hypothetical protein V7201_14405 [Bacillus sp. JJ1122]|uniref:hypothetical protein n=1 Tax=Bacillus sp. JJ1122 TaxID=3122951 RepID=UPI002FFE9B4A